jgi:hypothetical protein
MEKKEYTTVTYIADVRADEVDILEPVKNENLKIYKDDDIKGEVLIKEITAPIQGWTNEELYKTNEELKTITTYYDVLNSYVGNVWVGSSEV